jgi:hypothetical protein
MRCRAKDCDCGEFMKPLVVVSRERFEEVVQVPADYESRANPNRVVVEDREIIRNSADDEVVPPRYVTKDSGARAEFDSGMVRDTDDGKARFELLLPLGVPYDQQFLVRVAELLARGAQKYDDRNWEKAQGEAEMERFKSSALRHLMQWAAGETDEDHAAAVVFNLLGYETTKYKNGA